MTWQGGRTRATGELVIADDWADTHYTNPIWEYNQLHSGAFVTNSGDLTPAINAALSFNTEEQDTDDYHDAVNPSRLTAPDVGVYLISFYATADAATAFYLTISGVNYTSFDGTHTEISKSVRLVLPADAYAEIKVGTAGRTIYAGAAFSMQQEVNGSS